MVKFQILVQFKGDSSYTLFALICCIRLLLFPPCEFFMSANADGLSQKFEWQQIS